MSYEIRNTGGTGGKLGEKVVLFEAFVHLDPLRLRSRMVIRREDDAVQLLYKEWNLVP